MREVQKRVLESVKQVLDSVKQVLNSVKLVLNSVKPVLNSVKPVLNSVKTQSNGRVNLYNGRLTSISVYLRLIYLCSDTPRFSYRPPETTTTGSNDGSTGGAHGVGTGGYGTPGGYTGWVLPRPTLRLRS